MKTKTILFLICLGILLPGLACKAQDSLYNQRIYKAWLKPMESNQKIKGVFYQNTDSSVVISNSIHRINYLKNDYTTKAYQVDEIRMLKLRRTRNIGKGIGIGLGVGVGVGLIVAAITVANEDNSSQSNTWDLSSDNHTAEFIGIPLLFGSLGAATGAVIGSLKVTIPIHGKKDTYQKQRKRLERYAIKRMQNAE